MRNKDRYSRPDDALQCRALKTLQAPMSPRFGMAVARKPIFTLITAIYGKIRLTTEKDQTLVDISMYPHEPGFIPIGKYGPCTLAAAQDVFFSVSPCWKIRPLGLLDKQRGSTSAPHYFASLKSTKLTSPNLQNTENA
ncbi:hypothetical protein Bbelb_435210 [Branchiostoma belcheri]|nr:hypothetical protein Bbelb_435210 [Branchiostoma belcheri]